MRKGRQCALLLPLLLLCLLPASRAGGGLASERASLSKAQAYAVLYAALDDAPAVERCALCFRCVWTNARFERIRVWQFYDAQGMPLAAVNQRSGAVLRLYDSIDSTR